MLLEAWAITDVGLKRSSNQDSYYLSPEMRLYIVADGMGGHLGGEVASQMAVQTISAVIRQALDQSRESDSPVSTLRRAYATASERIYQRTQKENPELKGMGTTAVSFWVRDQSAYIGNVGDSRVYLYQNSHLWQLTEDHSLVAEQLRAGLLTPESAKNFAGRNIITRSVGFDAEVDCDILERPLRKGDIYILCSDGLTGQVSDSRLQEILRTNEPKRAVSIFIDEAKHNGGDDNVTALVVQVTSV